jgi:hypothetical protein
MHDKTLEKRKSKYLEKTRNSLPIRKETEVHHPGNSPGNANNCYDMKCTCFNFL